MELRNHCIIFLPLAILPVYTSAEYCFTTTGTEYCDYGCCNDDDFLKECCDTPGWIIALICVCVGAVIVFICCCAVCYQLGRQKKRSRVIGTGHLVNNQCSYVESGNMVPFVHRPPPPPYVESIATHPGAPAQTQLYNHQTQELDPTCPPGESPGCPPPPAVYIVPTTTL